MRLANIYGAAKMQATWPDERTLKLAKMEYARAIGAFTRDQIHAAFEAAKGERQAGNARFDWPNVDAILGLLSRKGEITGTWGSGAHRPFRRDRALADINARERAQQAGKQALGQMKALFA